MTALYAIPKNPPPPNPAERIRQLQAEVRGWAADNLARKIAETRALAAEYAEMADCTAYGPGVRYESRQAADDLRARADRLQAIQERQKP